MHIIADVCRLGEDADFGLTCTPLPLNSIHSISIVISKPMRQILRFLWNSTRGHRLAPWRSPYLLWRIETYCGVKTQQIGFWEFWEFVWRERRNLGRFLKWTAEMERYVHPNRGA